MAADIKVYKCQIQGAGTITPEIAEKLELVFPDAYIKSEYLQKVAKYLQAEHNYPYAHLPLCHTIEADAMGAIINCGDANFGPRAGGYAITDAEQILEMKDIDFTQGRIKECLDACEAMVKEGKPVMFDISGPFNILSPLMDLKIVFKAFRKRKDIIDHLYAYLERNLLAFVQELLNVGVTIISYADSAGCVSILGPDMTERVTREFVHPFLKKAQELCKGKALLSLCPKTTYALLGCELAEWGEVKVGEGNMTYQQALLAAVGKAEVMGEACIKDEIYVVNNGTVKTVVIK